MRRLLTAITLSVTITACAAPHQPPALPEPSLWPDQPATNALPEIVQPTPAALPPPPPLPPPAPALVMREPVTSKKTAHRKNQIKERPESVLREANTAALVTPKRLGYFGESAIQRYIYQPGKVYLVISSPSHPTTLFLPPGERLAAAPVVDPEAWEVSATEMQGDAHRVEAIMLRPFKPGLESTLPLLTQGGRAYFCRIRSQEALGMVAVTWELPAVQVFDTDPAKKLSRVKAPAIQAPVIALDRLHTGYTIDTVGKYRPAWFPQQVFDDGSKTIIRFKESLGYTSAPAVFTLHADNTPGIVEFTPYSDPERPERGQYYIVQGLWPELRLRGTDNQEVKIVRTSNLR